MSSPQKRDYGWDGEAYSGDSFTDTSLFILLYVFSFCIILWVNYHIKVVKKVYWYPETIFTMLFSAVVGGITNYSNHTDAFNTFQYELFFYIFIPPVIFFSSFQMNFGLFNKFFLEIFVLANIGTCISALVIGYILYVLGNQWHMTSSLSMAECISFGSLISATDPVSTLSTFSALKVEPVLNVIILGSSIIDDAISVILSTSLNKFVGLKSIDSSYILVAVTTYFIINVIASIALGILCGIFLACFIRRTLKVSGGEISGDLLVGMAISMTYLSFMLASCCQISGIICCLVTSFVFRRYCPVVLHAKVYDTMAHVIGSISYLFENLIFMSLGLSLTQMPYLSGYNFSFILYTYLASQIGRAAFVYPLSYFLNEYRFRRDPVSECENNNESSLHKPSSSTSSNVCDTLESGNTNNLSVQLSQYERSDIDNPAPSHVNLSMQHVIMLAGLRGPISYSSSMIFPDDLGNRALIVATTRALIVITILQATPLSYMLKRLNIRTSVDVPPDDDLLKKEDDGEDIDDANSTVSKMSWLEQLEMKYVMSYIIDDD